MVDHLLEIPLPGRQLAAPTQNLARRDSTAALPAFVAGPENRLVAATVERFIASTNEGAASQAAVVVLFGPTGVGKTHLAHGLVRHWQRQLGEHAAHYITAADFRRELSAAMDANRLVAWRDEIRSHSLLAIDDLHGLPNLNYLMQELRYTIDAIVEAGGRLVVTSQRPVETLGNLPPDVRSRLAAGLSLQLAPPGMDARTRIIRHASAALGRQISASDAARIAHSTSGGAARVLGALFEHWSPRSATAADALGPTPDNQQPTEKAKQPTLREIIAVVARYTNVTQKLLKSASRRQSVVLARAMAVYLARQVAGISYEQIGLALGGRDHTTIMHNYRKMERDIAANPATQESIEHLRRLLAYR